MEDATCKPIIEFYGLLRKLYSFLIIDKGLTTEKQRAKGIKSRASPQIRQQYIDQLQRLAENYLPNHRIGSTLHKMYTIDVGENSCSTFEKYINHRFHIHFNIFPCLFILFDRKNKRN